MGAGGGVLERAPDRQRQIHGGLSMARTQPASGNNHRLAHEPSRGPYPGVAQL